MSIRERIGKAVAALRGVPLTPVPSPVAPREGSGGWWPLVREPHTGAWQRNQSVTVPSLLENAVVFSCVTLIANDIGKLPPRLMTRDAHAIWVPTSNSAYDPVLRKPNRYQNHVLFKQQWQYSLLSRGNTYCLKERDNAGRVCALYILDPCAVQAVVAPDSSVFYRLNFDTLAGLTLDQAPVDWLARDGGSLVVPASEITHDRVNALFHPLMGLSPLYAGALAAYGGSTIQTNAAQFFANAARPSGILTAPAAISDDTAKRLKDYWDTNFTGNNSGRVAVLGDGLKFEGMTMSAVDAQLIDQLKWTSETIAACFHIPPYKLGLGTLPSFNSGELLEQSYYQSALQYLIEQWELAMDDALELSPTTYSIELDVGQLLRMDTLARVQSLGEAIKAGWMAPNEARRAESLPPVPGGDSPFLQQQNWSLEALAQRPPPSSGGTAP